jgi:N-acyl-D-aspartate/D-glutamate deacylase
MNSLLIKDGFLLDGTGNPWHKSSILVEDGRIKEIGHPSPVGVDRTVNAEGLVVCPGFVEIHSHADWSLLLDPLGDNYLRQGTSTLIIGNCGLSASPFNPQIEEAYRQFNYPRIQQLTLDWSTMGEYLDKLDMVGLLHNVGAYVGHSTVRVAAMADPYSKASSQELEEMKRLVDGAMRDGAYGITTGLNFPPGNASDTEELVELCKIVAKYNGHHHTHLRSYSLSGREAAEEALEISRRAGLPIHFSHHHFYYQDGANLSNKEVLEMLDEAREEGIDATCNWMLPWAVEQVNFKSMFGQIFGDAGYTESPWILEIPPGEVVERLKDPVVRAELKRMLETEATFGGFDRTFIMRSRAHPQTSFVWSPEFFEVLPEKSVADMADEMGLEPIDALIQMIIDEGEDWGAIAIAVVHYTQKELDELITHPSYMVAGDHYSYTVHSEMAKTKNTPKAFGTFPRVISKCVRMQGILTMEEAIRKMTSFPAQTIGLRDRGLLREGMWADILVFHPERFRETSNMENPFSYPEGVELLLVNGEVAVEKDETTGRLAGKTLRAR